MFIYFKKYFTFYLGEGKEKKRERNIDVQEKHWPVASRTTPAGGLDHNPGMVPDLELSQRPSVCGMMPNPLSHTSQGHILIYLIQTKILL